MFQINSKETAAPKLVGSAPNMGSSEFLQNSRGKPRPHNERTFAHTSALSRTRAHTQKVLVLKVMFSRICCPLAWLEGLCAPAIGF